MHPRSELCAGALLSILVWAGGCGGGHTVALDYVPAAAEKAVVEAPGSVAVDVEDRRLPVVSGLKKASYLGTLRTGTGERDL